MQLAAILGQISGVGRVEVLLTEAAGADTVYQVDTRQNQANADTVIITDRNREETGLVKQIFPPVYRGAVVVCQGADSAGVRLNVVDAVKSVTGLSSDCITVLKMK
jgi:stage III sporulation protein AG